MNAHTPKRLLQAAVPTPCPAAAIGEQLARVQRRLAEMDEARAPDDAKLERERRELYDLEAALDVQLEHVVARSPDGLFWQVAQLGVLLEDTTTDPEGVVGVEFSAERYRAIVRMQAVIRAGLEVIAGVNADLLGAGAKVMKVTAPEQARAILAG